MPIILYRAQDIETRRRFRQRQQVYRQVLRALRMASVMLEIAKVAEPGPDRLSSLWCACGELENARRFALFLKIPIKASLKRLCKRYSEIAREAGHGEFYCEPLDGEIKIVSRGENGVWRERHERVH